LLLAGFLSGIGAWLWPWLNQSSPPRVQPKTAAIKPDLSKLPIDLNALAAAALNDTREVTPAQQAETEEYYREQVADATESLHDIKVEERIAGAEQLAAYPTPEAEISLVEALTSDTESEVRRTAAISLQEIARPKKPTVDALFAALEDESEDVQIAACDTLTRLVDRLDSESAAYRKLIGRLKKKLASKRVSTDVRADIKAFLDNQDPG